MVEQPAGMTDQARPRGRPGGTPALVGDPTARRLVEDSSGNEGRRAAGVGRKQWPARQCPVSRWNDRTGAFQRDDWQGRRDRLVRAHRRQRLAHRTIVRGMGGQGDRLLCGIGHRYRTRFCALVLQALMDKAGEPTCPVEQRDEQHTADRMPDHDGRPPQQELAKHDYQCGGPSSTAKAAGAIACPNSPCVMFRRCGAGCSVGIVHTREAPARCLQTLHPTADASLPLPNARRGRFLCRFFSPVRRARAEWVRRAVEAANPRQARP